MADKKMYKVGITVKEPWSADISYEVLDITLYAVENGGDGCSYIAIRANQGVTPGTDDTVWVKATQRGQSIYDLAVKYGDFEGTEAEFEAEYEAAVHAAQSAAQSASDIEAQVETNEAARVTAERARSDAETARSSAETARINAENARDDAESLRDTAESDRVRAEAGRVTAEASRVEAETFRQGAEQSRRQQFEGLKTDMETAIDNVDAKSAEIAEDIEGYEANEAGRVSAENARATAESARVSAEQGRAAAETQRAEQAASDHTRAESDHTRAEEAAAAAEHMVDIKQGPQGPQGNTGSSVDYPYELVNNLTTDDATKGLSAAQGVVLEGEVSQLCSEVDEIRTELTGTQSVTGKIISYTSDILTSGKYVNRTTGAEGTSSYRSCTDFLPVTPGAEVKFNVCGGAANYIPSGYVFYDQSKNYVSGDGSANGNPIDVSLVVPAGAYFIRVTFVNSGDGRFSSFYYNYKESGEFDSVKSEVDSLWDYNGKIVLYNGSNGNPNNPNAVRSCVIPTNGAKYVTIKINRPNTAGCYYAFAYALTSDTRDIGSTSQVADWYGKIYAVDLYGNQTDAVIDISSFPTAVGIAITIGEFDSNNIIQTRRITDFDGYDVCVERSPLLEELIDKKLEIITSGDVVERNKEREIPLEAMCRYRKTSSPIKDAQFCVCTDSHADAVSVNNAVSATNGFDTIDGFVHCGDITASYYDTGQVASFQNSIDRLTKPGYIVVGNHDVGNAFYVGICCDHAQAYAAYIKPMVDKGWLVSGEYTANKPYWYHDIDTYKIRLIGLYEYDDAMDFNETYWRAITYNSGLSNIATNTAYPSGAQVNVPGYTAHSFEAVQAVTTPASHYTTPEKFPSYKVRRGDRVIRQEQAQWYLDTLLSTPANYGIVVILHNPFADDAQVMDVKFSQLKSGTTGASYSQNDMATDLIGGALAAFAAGSNYSVNVAMKGDAAYMNTQGGGTYAYSVSKNFTSKNTGVKVFGLLGGHSHRDLVWGKGDLVQVTPICATTNIANATSGDIRRADTDGLTKDSLTVVSFAAQRIGLVKIGVNVTDTGYARDFEVIPVNN